VWSCVSAAGIESFLPPTDVRKVIVFADNDVSGTGQAAAWGLAKRLIAARVKVELRLPDRIGSDWADYL
jgi:putative DNA primase/helicase